MTKNQKTEELKKILIVGSGGRENSIAWALSKNQSIEKIYVCPGNGGTANFEKCICLKPKAEDAQTIIEASQPLNHYKHNTSECPSHSNTASIVHFSASTI